MAARIRAARMEEFDELDRLMRRAANAHPDAREALREHPEFIRISPSQIHSGRMLVAETDTDIAGFAAWLPIGDSTAELEALHVDPAHWEGEIATILVKAVCDAVAHCGLRNLFVVAPPELLDFYRGCGFVRSGASATKLGPFLTLIKVIAPG